WSVRKPSSPRYSRGPKQMKKTAVLTGIAALFLATGTAHAEQFLPRSTYSGTLLEPFLPPEEFDHEYHGTLTVFPIIDPTMLNFPRGCRTTVSCAYRDWRGPNTCAIWIADREEIERQGYSYDLVYRHEIGHCNGWHHNKQD